MGDPKAPAGAPATGWGGGVTSTVSNHPGDHHGLSAHEVVLLLDSDPLCGLSSAEAGDRLHRFGANALPTPPRVSSCTGLAR